MCIKERVFVDHRLHTMETKLNGASSAAFKSVSRTKTGAYETHLSSNKSQSIILIESRIGSFKMK